MIVVCEVFSTGNVIPALVVSVGSAAVVVSAVVTVGKLMVVVTVVSGGNHPASVFAFSVSTARHGAAYDAKKSAVRTRIQNFFMI